MMKNLNKQPTGILSILLFCLGFFVSLNVFSANEEPSQGIQIGNYHAGGIVFYVDEKGQHGLIAALVDQSTKIPWSNGILKVTGATNDGIGAGMMNTAIIVSAQSNDTPGGSFAAKVAADYAVLEDGFTRCAGSAEEICFSDWYLPSREELSLMVANLYYGGLGGFASDLYWSSTEARSDLAWTHNIFFGIQNGSKKSDKLRVRAIRAF